MGIKPSELKKEDLEVITAMNAVYFGERGRPGTGISGGDAGVGGWLGTQAGFAADYFSKLLEGSYIDLSSQLERRIKADAPQERVINQALNAFTDFTDGGWGFLYYAEPNISSEAMRAITLKLIKKIGGANFTNREYATTAITVLTGMKNEDVLPSARNTWLMDHSSRGLYDAGPYDASITNEILIPEAIQYARRNIPFIK